MMHRNAADALVEGLRLLLSQGEIIPSRAGTTRELRAHVMRIERPLERVIAIPERQNNVFASLAETLWVLGGRDDLAFLGRYLPRAAEFSDDGVVWRAAYGPRLRNWHGVDQLKEVAKVLSEDPGSRRATMIIFDPARDYVESRDIPCNNWLHFLIRDGSLHLSIAVRSNDAIWGFSGINAFEWSVVQEVLAHWTGTRAGTMTFLVSSFHLYERHFERAQKIVDRAKRWSLYDFGFAGPRFTTALADLDAAMERFFELEGAIRRDEAGVDERISGVSDPFLRASLQLLRVYNLYLEGAPGELLGRKLDALPTCDLRIGAIDFLLRQKRLLDVPWFSPRAEEEAFFASCSAGATRATSLEDVYALLCTLHEKKSRVYGDSWKKHGEILGVFANITRKYDRIESVRGGAQTTADESLVHTCADLAVYAGKYLTFLAEAYPEAFGHFLEEQASERPAREYRGNGGFDAVTRLLLDWYVRDESVRDAGGLDDCLALIRKHYSALERILTSASPDGQGEAKCRATAALSLAAALAMSYAAALEPAILGAFAREVELL